MVISNSTIKIYRISFYLHKKKLYILSKAFTVINRIIAGCYIGASAEIGENLNLGYGGLGVVIHPDSKIGSNVSIGTGVTLGGKGGGSNGVPVIEDNVTIGSGAKILGPITIGEGSSIGANAVVISNVPPGSTFVGIPAKPL